jgi:L-lactate dehydrogenase complex protein LldG
MLHIALLRTADLYADLPAFFTALGSGAFEQVKDASMLTLVSGPSRTADIEMTLTIGVHGPGEVHVFCYEQV